MGFTSILPGVGRFTVTIIVHSAKEKGDWWVTAVISRRGFFRERRCKCYPREMVGSTTQRVLLFDAARICQ